MRVFAAIFLTAFLMADAASASSFVVLAPMKEKLGPSMIALGTPAPEAKSATAKAATAQTAPIATTELDYPYPGGQAPVILASAILGKQTPLNYPAPAPAGEAAKKAADYAAAENVHFLEVSPSIIAMAEPDVSFEEVSGIKKTAGGDPHGASPMVIRGGIVGDAFARTLEQPVKVIAPAASGPAKPAMSSGMNSAASASSAAASGGAPAPKKEEKPPVPIPSPTPAPPPADIVPRAKIE